MISGVIADFDRDGRDEVMLVPSYLSFSRGKRRSAVYRYDLVGRRLARAPLPAFEVPWSVMAAIDLDGDGNLDLLGNRAQPVVAWGADTGAVAPAVPLGVDRELWSFDRLAALYFLDVDSDGWLDVLTAEAGCCPECNQRNMSPYLRTGPRSFAQRDDLLPPSASSNATAAFGVEMRPVEMILAALGSPCDHGTGAPVFFRRAGHDDDGWPRFVSFNPIPRDPGVSDLTNESPLSRLVPMGAAVGDLDRDGLLDLAVTLDPMVAIFQGRPTWPLVERSLDSLASRVYLDTGGVAQVPWAVLFLDVDRDGVLDMLTTHGNDGGRWGDPAFQVGQFTTLHLHRQGFCFQDATAQSGLGRRGQWHALSVGDLDQDGAADLVGGGDTELPRTFHNDLNNGRHGLTLRLRGTTRNALGVGAQVEVTVAEGEPVQRHLVGGFASPNVYSEPRVFVGLGDAGAAATVRVIWPSGTVQVLHDVPAALQVIEEPPMLVLDPPLRRRRLHGHPARDPPCTRRVDRDGAAGRGLADHRRSHDSAHLHARRGRRLGGHDPTPRDRSDRRPGDANRRDLGGGASADLVGASPLNVPIMGDLDARPPPTRPDRVTSLRKGMFP